MNCNLNEETLKMHEEHLNGLMLVELSKKYNLSRSAIYYRFKTRNLKIIKDLHKSTKYKVSFNEDYFSNVDSENKAYFLGLIFADGYIRKRNKNSFSLGLKLQSEDKYIIEKLQSELCAFSYKIQEEKNNFKGNYKLEVQSNKLVTDLINLGIKFNKSYEELSIPHIDNIMFFHFLRGLIDGDGWISIGKTEKVQIAIGMSSIVFLQEIQKILLNYDIKSAIYKRDDSIKNVNWGVLYTLYISDNKSRLKLLNLLYNNSTIYLNRKYNKYIHANTVLSSKITKGLETV